MPDYMLLMHRLPEDTAGGGTDPEWGAYLTQLRATGRFQGGSSIGGGVCVRKAGTAPPITAHLSGFMRISADDLEDAQAMLTGNPVFENGGTIEIRELPREG